MNDYFQDYLIMLRVERNVSANTIDAYRRDLKQYLGYIIDDLEIKSLYNISSDNIRDYIRNLNNQGLAPKSIARIISSIRSYHNFLSSEQIIKENPALNLDTPKIPKKLPLVLSEKEISDIIKAVDDAYQFAKRDKAIIEML